MAHSAMTYRELKWPREIKEEIEGTLLIEAHVMYEILIVLYGSTTLYLKA